MLKSINKYIFVTLMVVCSASLQAMTLWVVETGQDPFFNSQETLVLSPGVIVLDLYYDASMDEIYGYDLTLDITGTGSIANVRGGDSGLGNFSGSGWRQLGEDDLSFYGETGSSVLAFSFDFTADAGASLFASGSYTDSGFLDITIPSSTLVTVSAVPVPAAIWLFCSGIVGLVGAMRRAGRV